MRFEQQAAVAQKKNTRQFAKKILDGMPARRSRVSRGIDYVEKGST
jgi:hypothetical protein